MTFQSPWRLLSLAGVVALAVAYLIAQARSRHYALRFTTGELLDRVAPKRPGWRRHLPAGLFLLMLSILCLGFARPATEVPVPVEQATIVLVIDVSLSMQATDIPPNRLAAEQAAAKEFVAKLPAAYNVAVVSFAENATVLVPPTTDRIAVRTAIDGLQLAPSTAIGEGIAAALTTLRTFASQTTPGAATPTPTPGTAGTGPAPGATPGSNAPPAVPKPDIPARIVLLSDGSNTVGRNPIQAAQQAKDTGVPIYTIAYGTDDGVIVSQGQTVPVDVDKTALSQVAATSGGKAYEAGSVDQLREVYTDIGSKVGSKPEFRDISARFIGVALLVGAVCAGLSLRWFSRLP